MNNNTSKKRFIIDTFGEFSFFKFAADNSNAEWLLLGLSTNGKTEYKIATSHDKTHVYNTSKDNAILVFHLHSHPNNSNLGETRASGNYKWYISTACLIFPYHMKAKVVFIEENKDLFIQMRITR